ncbi:MAG: Lcl C-terminal domain-containing protein [Alphaproteobacteria bacterium]
MKFRFLMFVVLFFSIVFVLPALLACDDDDDDDDDDDFACDGDVCTDTVNSRMWERTPGGGLLTYDEAVAYCDELSLDGHDDWYLPNIDDLRSLILGCPATELGGACPVSTTCYDTGDCQTEDCDGCGEDNAAGYCYWSSLLEGSCEDWHWSSTADDEDGDSLWGVDYHTAEVEVLIAEDFTHYVRCTRVAE